MLLYVFVCYQSWQQHSYIPCMLPLLCYQCYPVLSCVTVCFCVLSGLATAQLHSMPLISCYPVLSCVTVCYGVLSGLAAEKLLHTMPVFLLCYQCYPVLSCVIVCYRVFLCVIRVGNSIVAFHASDIVLSCVIVCYCVLSGLAAAALLHTMALISCYQCYPVLSCVTVRFCVLSELAAAQLHSMHASFTVLSMLSCVIVCYCVLSGLAAVRLLHTMPGF